MIKYRLICKNCDLKFDSWFASSLEYEKLKKKKFLNCHSCNSLNIEKTLMAPTISKKLENKNINNSKQLKDIKKTIQNYQKFIKNNFEYVGKNFAYEARSIHYNLKNKKQKNIYGIASEKEFKDLREEGVDAQIIPWFEDKNN